MKNLQIPVSLILKAIAMNERYVHTGVLRKVRTYRCITTVIEDVVVKQETG